MIPRKHKLPSNLISDVLKNGRFVYNHFFLIKYKFNTYGYSRIAVIVSTKIDKRAVIRNKLKRRILGLFSGIINKIPKPLDIVVITKKKSVYLKNNEFDKKILELLEKINSYVVKNKQSD